MADENNQNNQNNEQSGSYYEPQQAENTNQYYQPQQSQPQQQQAYYQVPQGDNSFNYNVNMPPQEEKANVGLAVLSFFIPIVGLILYITKKNDKPKTAKACGKAALACVIISVILSFIMGIASVFIAKKAIEEDPAASEFLNDYSDYLNDYLDDNSNNNALIDDSDAITTDTLGGARFGSITKPVGVWKDYSDINYNSENMLGYTNNSEIITMAYYDGTGYTKEDIRGSVTSSLTNASATVDTDAVDKKDQQFSYDDFYAESEYITYNNGYQLFMIFFQSDATSDMMYIAIESADMDTAEFAHFVNGIVNSHSFVTQPLDISF